MFSIYLQSCGIYKLPCNRPRGIYLASGVSIECEAYKTLEIHFLSRRSPPLEARGPEPKPGSPNEYLYEGDFKKPLIIKISDLEIMRARNFIIISHEQECIF